MLIVLLVAAQTRTTVDSVYTAAQAKRGEAAYSASCASCHAADLSGKGQASSLAGKDFNDAWNEQSLGDLFERIQTTMPADAPGTLKPADTADVIAFLLSKASFPAGDADLPADAATLEAITFVAPRRDEGMGIKDEQGSGMSRDQGLGMSGDWGLGMRGDWGLGIRREELESCCDR